MLVLQKEMQWLRSSSLVCNLAERFPWWQNTWSELWDNFGGKDRGAESPKGYRQIWISDITWLHVTSDRAITTRLIKRMVVLTLLKPPPGIQATHNKKVAPKPDHPPEQVQNIKRQKGKKLGANRILRILRVLRQKIPTAQRDSALRLDWGRPLLVHLPPKRQVLHFQRQ